MNGDWHKAESAARLSFGDFADESRVLPAPLAGGRIVAALAIAAAAAAGFYLLF